MPNARRTHSTKGAKPRDQKPGLRRNAIEPIISSKTKASSSRTSDVAKTSHRIVLRPQGDLDDGRELTVPASPATSTITVWPVVAFRSAGRGILNDALRRAWCPGEDSNLHGFYTAST